MDTIAIYSIYSAISCVLLASGLQIYIKLRSLINYRVNCWFCNCNSKVSYKQKITGWNCKHCEQYNGFSSDGDYNRDIPEQYIEQLNGTPINKELHTTSSRNNILCQTCTHNFEIKIKQLANFRPVDENDFDKEVERFSNFLEQAYPLCDICEQATQKTINEKNAKLIGDLVNHKLKSSQKNKRLKYTNLMIDMICKFLNCTMFALANILCIPFIPETTLDSFSSEHQALLKNSYDWINLNVELILISILVINLFLVINIKPFKTHITTCVLWLISLVVHHYHIHYIEKYLFFTSLLFTYMINLMSLIKKKTKTKKSLPKIKKNTHIVRRLHQPSKSPDKDFLNLDSLSLGSRDNFNNSSTMNANFLGGNPLFESYKANKINTVRPRQTLLAQPRLQFHRSPNNSNNHWASTLSECEAPSRSSSQSSGIASLADLDTLSVKSEPIYQNNRLCNQQPSPLGNNKFLSNPRSWSPAPGLLSPSPAPNCSPQWSPSYQNYAVLHVAKNWNTPPQSHWSPPSSPWSSDPGSISSDSTSSPVSPYFPPSYQMVSPKETIITYLMQSRLFLFLVGLLFIYNLVGMFISGYHAILLPLIRLGPMGIINGLHY